MRIHRPDRFIKAWRELEEASIPLEPEALSAGLERSYGLTMRHEPYSYDVGYVREIRRCRVAYMVPVFIRRDEPGKTIIRKYTLQSPWDDSIKWLVEDKEKNAGWYTFSEESYPRKHEYPRDMILNHQMIGSLRHGDIREGLLLGVGTVPIPDEYCSGDKIPITVCIRDEWDCEPSATFDLQLTRCRANEVRKSTRGPLLSRRDPVVPDNPLKATPTPVKKDYDEVEHFMEAVSAVTPYLSAMKRSGVGRNNKKRV